MSNGLRLRVLKAIGATSPEGLKSETAEEAFFKKLLLDYGEETKQL